MDYTSLPIQSDTRSFSAIRQLADQITQGRRHAPPADELVKIFADCLTAADVVSFDVFDTALVRRVHLPSDVFLHLDQASAFTAYPLGSHPIWQLRIQAEKAARRKLVEATGSTEANLEEIYESFCDLAQWPRHQVPDLARAEEAVELEVCMASPAMFALYERARAAGKRTIFISDSYHSCRFMRELLEVNGYSLGSSEALFVSSEHRLNKQSGQLFTKVLDWIEIRPERVLHVGDHSIADVERPRTLGIKAILHCHRASGNPPVSFLSPAPVHSYLRGASFIESKCHEPPRDFWWLLGHNVIGPLLTGFCLWLEHCFRADGVEQAWFLLRDGEMLHRVFRTLFDGRTQIATGTLHSSRRAYLVPVLELAPRLLVGSVMTGYGARSPREYLTRFHLDAETFAKEVGECGFNSLDQVIDGQADQSRLQRLKQHPRVYAALLERSKSERLLLEGYLRQQGLFADRKIALVDIGWRGTIQKAIHLLLADSGRQSRLFGYYLGTTPGFNDFTVPGLQFKSYLMHLGEPRHVARQLELFFVEIFCSDNSGSLLHFEQVDGNIQCVFQTPDTSSEQCNLLAKVHEGIIEFAESFREKGPRLGLTEIPPLIAAENLLRLISNPTKVEAVHIGQLSHCDNATSARKRFLAKFRQANDIKSVWEDYRAALWKPGLLAQPNAQAAALRTLLWLMQE